MNKKVPVKFDRQHSYDSAMSNALSSGSTIFFTTKNPGSEENHAIVIGGKEYGREVKTKKHCLPYTEDVSSGIYSESIVQRPFMYDGECGSNRLYVVDNNDDWSACTKQPVDNDILQNWEQFTQSPFSPEYSSGVTGWKNSSYTSLIGYNKWQRITAGSNIITNNINSYDFNSFISPLKSRYHDVVSVIGCTATPVTIGYRGVSIINKENAIPKHIIDSDGVIYYRNTLYDLDPSNTLSRAWVNTNAQNPLVIYSGRIPTGLLTYEQDDIPTGTCSVYTVQGTSSYIERTTQIGSVSTVTINAFEKSSGFIASLNIIPMNSTGIWRLDDNGGGAKATGTIYIYGGIISLDENDTTYYDMLQSTYNYRTTYQPQIIINGTTSVTDETAGSLLVNYNGNLDQDSSSSPYSFIKTRLIKNNEEITILFSDVTSAQTPGQSASQFLEHSDDAGVMNYISSIHINLNDRTYQILDCSGVTHPIQNFASTLGDVNIYNKSTSSYDTKNLWEYLSGDTQLMYYVSSDAFVAIKSDYAQQVDRIVLDVESGGTPLSNTVWKYNTISKTIEPVVGAHPLDYFYGSHMAYNDITKKLWYSNGTNIYELKTSQDIPSALTDSVSAITDSASTKLTQEQAVYNYLKPHTHESSAITDSVSAITNSDSGTTELVQGRAIYDLLFHQLVESQETVITGQWGESVKKYNVQCELNGKTVTVSDLHGFTNQIYSNPKTFKWSFNSPGGGTPRYIGIFGTQQGAGEMVFKIETSNSTDGKREIHNCAVVYDQYSNKPQEVTTGKDGTFLMLTTLGWNIITRISAVRHWFAYLEIPDTFVGYVKLTPIGIKETYSGGCKLGPFCMHAYEPDESIPAPTNPTGYTIYEWANAGGEENMETKTDAIRSNVLGIKPEDSSAHSGYTTYPYGKYKVDILDDFNGTIKVGEKLSDNLVNDFLLHNLSKIVDSLSTSQNYLPLAGGTMTGSILSNTTACTVGTTSAPFGSMYSNGFYQTSDMNKKNILGELPLDKAYDMVEKCNTILYTLKGDETNKQQIGLIAQEVEQFFPEIVSTGEDGSKSLDYARITVVLLGVLRDIVDRLNSIESK